MEANHYLLRLAAKLDDGEATALADHIERIIRARGTLEYLELGALPCPPLPASTGR